MKHVFAAAFVVLGLMSIVAQVMKPEPVDHRVLRLEFILDHAGQGGQTSPDSLQTLFADLDRNGDGVADARDAGDDAAEALQERITLLIREFDEQGDRKVTLQEMQVAYEALDRNGDGVLSRADTPEAPPIDLVWVSDDNPMRREQIRLFNRLHPDYQLRLDPVNIGMEKIIVQCLAGVGPDVFDAYTGYERNAFVRAGVARDVTHEMNAVGVDLDELWPAVRPLILQGGRTYGHPTNAGANAIWYNKRMFDEAGLPYPTDDWTWDECIATAQRLTQRNERGQIMRYGLIGYWDWQMGIYQFGGDVFNEEGTRCVLDSPEACAGMDFMHDLIYKHRVMPSTQEFVAMSSAGGWGTGELALFGAGRSVMAIGGRWWLCILRSPTYAHLDLGAVDLPGLPLPDGSTSRRRLGYGKGTMVNANSQNVEGALLFLKYEHSEPYNELINKQADALAPVTKYNYTDEYLHDPDYPDEDYNVVWRKAMEDSVPSRVSPFVNGQYVQRTAIVQTDMVRANIKSGAQAMRDLAKKINIAIVKTLERDPELRTEYYRLLRLGAQPAWDNPEDAP